MDVTIRDPATVEINSLVVDGKPFYYAVFIDGFSKGRLVLHFNEPEGIRRVIEQLEKLAELAGEWRSAQHDPGAGGYYRVQLENGQEAHAYWSRGSKLWDCGGVVRWAPVEMGK